MYAPAYPTSCEQHEYLASYVPSAPEHSATYAQHAHSKNGTQHPHLVSCAQCAYSESDHTTYAPGELHTQVPPRTPGKLRAICVPREQCMICTPDELCIETSQHTRQAATCAPNVQQWGAICALTVVCTQPTISTKTRNSWRKINCNSQSEFLNKNPD